MQDGKTASTVDFLLERKVLNGGAFTIESEYSRYNRLGGYDANYAKSQGAYALGSLLLPKVVGIGKFEILGKYAIAAFTDRRGLRWCGKPKLPAKYRGDQLQLHNQAI